MLVAREPDAATDQAELSGGGSVLWDGRFTVTLKESGQGIVARFGAKPKGEAPSVNALPAVVRAGLPVLLREDDQFDVPSFTLMSDFNDEVLQQRGPPLTARFTPREPLTAPAFSVV